MEKTPPPPHPPLSFPPPPLPPPLPPLFPLSSCPESVRWGLLSGLVAWLPQLHQFNLSALERISRTCTSACRIALARLRGMRWLGQPPLLARASWPLQQSADEQPVDRFRLLPLIQTLENNMYDDGKGFADHLTASHCISLHLIASHCISVHLGASVWVRNQPGARV